MSSHLKTRLRKSISVHYYTMAMTTATDIAFEAFKSVRSLSHRWDPLQLRQTNLYSSVSLELHLREIEQFERI